MAKVFTFITVTMAIMALFSMLGIGYTATSQVLQLVSFDNPENIKTSGLLFDILFGTTAGIVASIAGTGFIIAGLFGRGFDVRVLLAGFVAALVGWVVGDMVTIITTTKNYVGDLPLFASIIKFLAVLE